MKTMIMMTMAVLTGAVMASAQEISSASERIVNQEPLKNISAGDWRIPRPDMVQVMEGGKDNALFTLSYKEDHGGLNHSMFPYVYGKNPLLNTAVLSLHLPPEKYREYNQLSCMVYPDVAERAALWFEVGGSGIWTQACRPLRPRQWNRISICWSNHTPEQAEKIKTAIFSRQVFGRLPGDPLRSRYYVKDFVLEKVNTGSETSWEASPEKIILPQTGFSVNYTKRALLSPDHKADTFQLWKDGKPVYRGKLRLITTGNGIYKTADFSEVKTPGVYRLKSGNLTSVPFEISYHHLKDLAEKNRHFLLCMRSGTKTPAHEACFLDDCIRSDNRQPVDVSGGWFDASDLRGYHSMAMKTILRPLALAYECNTPELYNEMIWGGRQLDKLYDKATGLPFTVHSLYPKNHPDKNMARLFTDGNFYKVNNYWTDNLPNSGDERVIHVAKGTYICHPDLLDSHWGMTAAGAWMYSAAQEKDRALAESVLKQSKRHFDFLCDNNAEELRKNGIGYYNPNVNTALALRLENAIAFRRATGKTYYRELAFELAERLLSRQQRTLFQTPNGYLTGFFCTSAEKNTATLERDNMSVSAMTRLAADYPEEDLYFKIHAALRIYADFYLLNPSATALPYPVPYPLLTEKNMPDAKKIGVSLTGGKTLYGVLPHSFLSGVLGATAMDTQLLAIYLGDPRLQEKASSFLNFHTGDNPAGRSYIADVGVNFRQDIMSSALGWIPGMMSNPNIRKGIPELPYNRHHGSNEIYTQTQAAYAVAATILAAPAKLQLNLKHLPPACRLEITDRTAGGARIVRTDLPESLSLELPGGTRYRFRFSNGLEWDETVLSGEKRTLSIDMKQFIRIESVRVPPACSAGRPFQAEVRVTYFGDGAATVGIAARTENLTPCSAYLEQKMNSGETAVFRFECTPRNAAQPYVFLAYPQNQRQAIRSAGGAVLQE